MKTFHPNTPPITPSEVEAIRGDRSQLDVASDLGIAQTTWSIWESKGISGPWAFLVREWADEAIDRAEPVKVYAESVRELADKFGGKQELADHLTMLEEAKRRDHRKIGAEMGLFAIDTEYVGPGMPLWLPKGTVLVEVDGIAVVPVDRVQTRRATGGIVRLGKDRQSGPRARCHEIPRSNGSSRVRLDRSLTPVNPV